MQILYIVAALLFIVGLKLLKSPQTARRGNFLSAVGMLLAILATVIGGELVSMDWILAALLIGTVLGIFCAYYVKMTAMPQLVAILNGFGGLASMLVGWGEALEVESLGWASYLATNGLALSSGSILFLLSAAALTIFVGAITFTGSLVAFGKLAEYLPSRTFAFPAQQKINTLLLLVTTAVALLFIGYSIGDIHLGCLHVLMPLALILGILFVLPIGGGDMPVVIALLNSLSGIAASMAGFVIGNMLLVIAGCLVGTSGIILTLIMCKAMNRSLRGVLFGGFGKHQKSSQQAQFSEPRAISQEDAYYSLEAASRVFIVPGYGMAVAQAQHAVKELGDALRKNGTAVSYVIHPVAGRMPGHMSVLLAEANVPYEDLVPMDQANREMGQVDVAIVVGANDIVNPAATDNPASPLYGMPIVEVSRAKTVLAMKRGQGKGFSGLQNELFSKPNTRMLYGDAKRTALELTAELQGSAGN